MDSWIDRWEGALGACCMATDYFSFLYGKMRNFLCIYGRQSHARNVRVKEGGRTDGRDELHIVCLENGKAARHIPKRQRGARPPTEVVSTRPGLASDNFHSSTDIDLLEKSAPH